MRYTLRPRAIDDTSNFRGDADLRPPKMGSEVNRRLEVELRLRTCKMGRDSKKTKYDDYLYS